MVIIVVDVDTGSSRTRCQSSGMLGAVALWVLEVVGGLCAKTKEDNGGCGGGGC